MASLKTIEIVKATAPVLKEHGETITKTFYKLLFDRHPEVKNIFNMSNQKKGTQQKALANAVFQYACYIDKLEMLGDAVETIAQKHVSLSIPKEAYPIVGKNLLEAIKIVLGDAATPEIIDAWAEAYGDLAVIFVQKEEKIYSTKENSIGGFRGTKEFTVVNKVKESDVITSFYLKRKDGIIVPKFIAGQYVALTVEIPNTEHKHTRNYSLSDSNDKDYLRISVKNEKGNPNGIVSNFLHSTVEVGSNLLVGMPSGEFVVKDSNNPIVFISGGVGITPLLSMFKTVIKNKKRKVIFIQCALNKKNHAFAHEINNSITKDSTSIIVYNEPLPEDLLGVDYQYKGYFSKKILTDYKIDKESDFYFCGPKAFMENVLNILLDQGLKKEKINYEFFGPKELLV